MLEIWYKSTLFEYDGPQIFEARDRIGGHYLAVAVEDNGTDSQYLVVGTELEKLRKFRIGEVDLRSLLVESSRYGWYLTSSDMNEDGSVAIHLQPGDLLQFDHLPDKNFFLHDSPAINPLISEARARDNLVVEIVTEPPETETGYRIRATTLSELLTRFQSLVRQAYRDEVRKQKKNDSPTDREIKQLTEMDVVIPAASGSFRILLESSKPKDLLGVNSELALALNIVDRLFTNAASVHKHLLVSKLHKTTECFDSLLNLLNKNNTNLSYAWAEPSFEKPRCRSMSSNQIQKYITTRKNRSKPAIEKVTLVGEVERINRERKTWGLFISDGSILTGVVEENGNQLNGLTVGKQYEFVCLRKFSEEDAKTEHVMTSFKPLKSLPA